MSRDLIFLPILVQVLLTLLVFVTLLQAKLRAVKAGTVDKARVALHEDAWPNEVLQVNNNIRNQFQLPVLFYVLALVLWALDAVGVLALAAAWLFVVSRLVHAWIHLTSNYVPNRRRAFTVGWFLLLVIVALVAWELIQRAIGSGP